MIAFMARDSGIYPTTEQFQLPTRPFYHIDDPEEQCMPDTVDDDGLAAADDRAQDDFDDEDVDDDDVD